MLYVQVSKGKDQTEHTVVCIVMIRCRLGESLSEI